MWWNCVFTLFRAWKLLRIGTLREKEEEQWREYQSGFSGWAFAHTPYGSQWKNADTKKTGTVGEA
jgi:hypothetical protein